MDLDLQSLELFDAVGRLRNVTRAAESLMVSQPAVSKRLKALERRLEVTLLERSGRGIRLTSEGELLAGFTRRIFSLVGEALTQLGDLQQLRRGRLAIGAGTTVAVYLMPEAIVRFRQRFPGITLHLETGMSQALAEHLRDGVIEFGLTEAMLPAPEFESTLLMSDELVGIVHPNHALAKAGSVSAKKFAAEPFVVREAESGGYSLVERVFRERKLKVQPIISLSSTEAVKRAVAAGLGASIVSRMSIDLELAAKKLAALKLTDVRVRRPIYIVRCRGRSESKAATAFLCILKHVIRGTLPKLRHR
jgi:DNA-binding transcriptional LysR family regulator